MNKDLETILESILFVWGDPLELKIIEELLPYDKNKILSALEALKKNLDKDNRGIRLKRFGTAYQLVTVSNAHTYIEKLVKKTPRQITGSSMEVLSIIAYKQPVTRVQIEDIRGVRSTSSIETLLSRGLIEEKGRLDQIGRPILYGTTTEFLRFFNLKSLEDLPQPKKEVEDED